MDKELSFRKIFKDNERVVFKYEDFYPGSLLKVLRNSFKGREIADYPRIWLSLLSSLRQQFDQTDECLVFLSPLHTTILSSQSVEEEWEELKAKGVRNRIFIEGKTLDRGYLCFSVESEEYLEDLVYRFYDSGMKFFLLKDPLPTERIVAALSHVRFEEGECSTDVFGVIVEIGYPSGKECFITAEAERESSIKEALEKFSLWTMEKES
jgi:hypothetical protein